MCMRDSFQLSPHTRPPHVVLFLYMAPPPPAAADQEEHPAPPLPLLLPSSTSPFPVIVIGLGLVGSAAARHLSAALGSSLLAIGPPEPSISWADYNGPFASHYDQGRLARISDPDPVWAAMAARSMARYSALEQASGIRFHEAIGSLRVSPLPDGSLYQSLQVGRQQGAQQELIEDHNVLQEKFPCFRFETGDAAIMERGAAGYINPRNMVSAQLALAQKNGACIVHEGVREIVPIGYGVRIVTWKGQIFWARKALVCAGIYSKFLLPGRTRVLDLTVHARTVLLAEVGSEEAERLRTMPTFIWHLPKNPYLNWAYGCPPVKYPDGRLALKVGGTAWEAVDVGHCEADLDSWFKGGGDKAERAALEDVLLRQLMPGLQTRSLSCKPCAVSFTAHGRPYIDSVDGERPASTARVFVAAGGCGAAAKSADEIGRMAALLVLNGRWVSDMDPMMFRAVFKTKSSK
ncbi:hypothetical protein GOP47_0001227 [Adiantum capillus-veneris]|uniref:FAD dependent oxidoreductase domain-containing protein n=1 Tax=Adiantum capillus-veneris TaxID=13818 RepID=A0A9D4ZRI1_ADICA|nr:hypothetical protein GOP47_0001227 [Adiantum capillus-veneris]